MLQSYNYYIKEERKMNISAQKGIICAISLTSFSFPNHVNKKKVVNLRIGNYIE